MGSQLFFVRVGDPSLGLHSFMSLSFPARYIMSYTLTAGGGGGVSYWQEARRMGLRWALARSLLGRGRERGALYPNLKRNEEYKTTHITT